MQKGKISQIIGPVVDVEFSASSEDNQEQEIPKIYDALEIKKKDGGKLVLETHQHMGGSRVRAVSMGSTDGLVRGMEVVNTKKPIQVPIGKEILGRMFDLTGNPIDGKEAVKTEKTSSIHRDAPSFEEQSTESEIFETGIKVIDLICPFIKGGKVGLFGGAGFLCRKDQPLDKSVHQ